MPWRAKQRRASARQLTTPSPDRQFTGIGSSTRTAVLSADSAAPIDCARSRIVVRPKCGKTAGPSIGMREADTVVGHGDEQLAGAALDFDLRGCCRACLRTFMSDS